MKCKGRVPDGGRSPRFHQCSRNEVKDGYCNIHHPDSVKARSDARSAKFRAECDARDAVRKTRRENANQVKRIAKHFHYPECWDTMAYPTLADAVCEVTTSCHPDYCTHEESQ